ncbi:Vegetative incompatibility protein HET-E-1 [Metarhizium anisopliae]|nr:Vegetative incompatibility protein HET-E-1 [Metarhizium anisopliae]
MLAGVWENCIRIWDTEQGELVSRITLESETVDGLDPKFLGNSTMIAIPFINKSIQILETQTGERCYELQTGFDIDELVPFPYDSSKLILILKRGELYQWNIGTREAVKMMDGLVSLSYRKVVISPSERIVAVFGFDMNLHILDTSGHERLEIIKSPFSDSMAFSDDDRLLAVSRPNGEIWVWNTALRMWTFRFESHLRDVSSLVFSPDTKYLASCGMPSARMGMSLHTQIWPLEVPHRRGVEDEQYESRKISNVNLSQDNKWIATVSDKSKVSLWSSSGRFERRLEDGGVMALKFSWDSTKLAFSTIKGKVGIWDLKRACSMEIYAFDFFFSSTCCLEFSRNDGLLAASAADQLKVFDVKESNSQAMKRKSQIFADHSSTFKLKTTCEHDRSMIWIACIALFGTWVAAGSRYANVILLWDVDTGQLINRISILAPSRLYVRTIDMRSIGGSTQILSSDSNDRLMIMEVPSGHIVKTMRTPPLKRIACNQDDHTQLFTNLGKIDLTQFDSGDYEDPNGVRFQGYGSSTDWVFKDGKRILWLPPDCRSHSISRNQIAIACPGGFLLCITFPDDISSFF